MSPNGSIFLEENRSVKHTKFRFPIIRMPTIRRSFPVKMDIYSLFVTFVTGQGGLMILDTFPQPLSLVFDPSNRIEKNWVPFCIDSSLYLIYGEDLHTVLECDPSTGYCRRISERLEDLDWDYGIIRGGTPALKVDDQFLTFFHSSIENPDIYERRVYFMGAYAFDPYFPFAIRAYTPSPIGLAEYYEETSSKKDRSKKVVFP